MNKTQWKKMGKAWKLEDRYSVVYCKKIRSMYELITPNLNPITNQEKKWMSLGRYKTLTEAKNQGLVLTSFPNDQKGSE